jgi:hypothetical protein
MAPKKSLENFFTNWKISGAAPQSVLRSTTENHSINNAYRFLSKSMLIPVGGSKYPNKLNWKGAVNSLDQYNLRNAQKNLIRRVNIAIAAQPTKGPIEIRKAVRFNISQMTRNQAIKAQVAAIKNQKEDNQGAAPIGRRSAAVTISKPASKATYGMF